jgi:tRNA threonylcarbamoyladenosine modification (KEOPS) complex Cgi121 subunit
MHAHEQHLSFINAKHVASLMHLHIAVARAIVNDRDGKKKTESFANEIVYHMYPTHSIKESFEKYGLKNAERGFFVLIFGVNQNKRLIDELKSRVSEALEGEKEIEDLSRHVEYQDIEKISKMFDIKEVEKKHENGFLNTIYSKLALKNI